MGILIFFGIILIFFIIIGVAIILTKLSEGKTAITDLRLARLELYNLKNNYEVIQKAQKEATNNYISKLDEKSKTVNCIKQELLNSQNRFEEIIKQKDFLFEQVKKKNTESLEYISTLMADHLTLQYDISENYLKTKKHPAPEEARRIRELKDETKEIVQRNKILQYKYEYLLQLFPDLELYVDDVESISEINNISNIGDLENSVDRTRYYLSRDEYNKMPENERNQLALDRYIKSQKSKWQIGRDYELFIGHEYSINGWDVNYFGIEERLEDMGRDLIVTKGMEKLVIQCKYWAQHKLIHEKHIAQLYGTTVQLMISSNFNHSMIPVFITNISLSSKAKIFADYLKVRIIEKKDFGEFPRIKCNINQDDLDRETKIYHLPMDQQYDKTKISKPGEFFAFTVQEAINAGFRRARKWYGNG